MASKYLGTVHLNLGTILVLVITVGIYSQNLNGQTCITNDWRKSKGICKPLNECPAGFSLLRAGINPDVCRRSVEGHSIICCPSEPRISEIMCDEYKKLYREVPPKSLLPYPFNQSFTQIEGEIVCPERSPLIFGGRDAKVDEFPHMAGLGWGNDPDSLIWRCGGTLISDEYVLTAAHCLQSNQGHPNYVLLGDIYKDVPKVKRYENYKRIILKIKRIIVHPNYKQPSVYNDIALLQLEHRVNLSTSVAPACLPQPTNRPELTTLMITTGWGNLATGVGQSNILQAVNLTRFPQHECAGIYDDNLQKSHRYAQGILRSQFCAGDREKRKDSCDGDSGGPISIQDSTLTCIYYLVGITSFGPLFCGSQAGVYTNVLSYLDWIEQIVWPN